MNDFEKSIHTMFDHIWDCEIAHPVFQDTVGDLMKAVLEAYNRDKPLKWMTMKESLESGVRGQLFLAYQSGHPLRVVNHITGRGFVDVRTDNSVLPDLLAYINAPDIN